MQQQAVPPYHGNVGDKLISFNQGAEAKALREVVGATIKALRTRSMLPHDYRLLAGALEQLHAADPCPVLRDVTVSGDVVKDMRLTNTAVVVVNSTEYPHLHNFQGSVFHLSRDSFNAASVIFPLIIDGPRAGFYQIRRDASVLHYNEHTMRLLGMSILMVEGFARVAKPGDTARIMLPFNEGAFYKGWFEPNGLLPENCANWRRHSFNRKSASNKDKRTPYTMGDGLMPYFTYIDKTHTVEECGNREQDAFHALRGLFASPSEDGLLVKICLNQIDSETYPLSADEQRRRENIIKGLADMYEDREFPFLSSRRPSDPDLPLCIR